MAALKHAPIYSDAGSWNTFNASYSWNKKWSIVFTQEFRLKENYTRLNQFYTNLGVEYKVSSKLKTSLVYRWIDKYMEDDRFSYRHRISWDIVAKQSFRKFSMSYRHRLQIENRNIFSSSRGYLLEYYSRHKFEASYKITKKIEPYFSTELRYQIFDPRNQESNDTWHRVRYQFGVDYMWRKYQKIGVYYMFQREFDIAFPENIYITGLEYSLDITPFIKQIKKAPKIINPFEQ